MLHLERFVEYLTATYGHDRLSQVAPRDVSGWRDHLAGGLGPSTVNHHLAPVSGFLAWVVAQGCGRPAGGQPGSRGEDPGASPPGPRALTPAQVRCRAEVT